MNATFVIEFTVKLDSGVDPESVTFDIDLADVIPVTSQRGVVKDAAGICGRVTGYTTVNNYID